MNSHREMQPRELRWACNVGGRTATAMEALGRKAQLPALCAQVQSPSAQLTCMPCYLHPLTRPATFALRTSCKQAATWRCAPVLARLQNPYTLTSRNLALRLRGPQPGVAHLIAIKALQPPLPPMLLHCPGPHLIPQGCSTRVWMLATCCVGT